MALLKAFVCQVVLFGLYKLFLEEIVEAHLVPDELTRNCIVGFVCLVCFGIQIYTDKDEDNAEVDENPKAKSESRGAKSAKKSEPSEMSATHETVGSKTSSPATTHEGIFAQCSPNVIKMNGTGVSDVPASTLKTSYNQETTTNPVLYGCSEANVCEESDDDGIEIDQFVAKKSDIEKVEQLKTVESKDIDTIKVEDVTEEAKHLRADEVIEPPDVPEEAKQSTAVEPEEVEPIEDEDRPGESEQTRTVEAEDVEVIYNREVDYIIEVNHSRTEEVEVIIKPEEVTAAVESKCLIANGEAEEVESTAVEPEAVELIKDEDVTRKAEQLKTVEDEYVEVIKSEDVMKEVNQSKTEEIKVIKPEEVTEAVVESKCLIANEEVVETEEVEVIKPESVTEKVRQSIAINDEVEATEFEELAKSVVQSECLLANGDDISSTQYSSKNTNLNICESEAPMTNGIDEESLNKINSTSNIIEEIKSKESVKEVVEIGNGQETTVSSQPDEYTNDIKESLSSQEISNTSSISTKVDNNLEAEYKNNADTTTLVVKEVSSPSEKLTVLSTSRQKATVASEVCVAPITIDISFIYACH